jgi:hypothetical protein
MDLQAELAGGHEDDRLLAVMTFPGDGRARRLDFACRLYDQHGSDLAQTDLLIGHDIAKLRELRRIRERRGQIAGALLIRASVLSRRRPQQASVGKAIRWYLKTSPAMDSTGAELPRSRKALLDSWHDFAPVAHLWAAWSVAIMASGADAEVKLDRLLALSESYLDFAARHHPPAAGRTGSVPAAAPLLDPDRSWHLAPGHGLILPPLPEFRQSARFDELMLTTRA